MIVAIRLHWWGRMVFEVYALLIRPSTVTAEVLWCVNVR